MQRLRLLRMTSILVLCNIRSLKYAAVLLGACCVFLVGFIDDLVKVSSRFKLVALIAASAMVCGAGGAFSELRSIDISLVEFPWMSWAITALWITGIAVAYNFIDGLDGLAGGLGVLASLVLGFFLLADGHYVAAVAPMVLAGAIAGFLRWNWHPARTFMGDGGSLMIGVYTRGIDCHFQSSGRHASLDRAAGIGVRRPPARHSINHFSPPISATSIHFFGGKRSYSSPAVGSRFFPPTSRDGDSCRVDCVCLDRRRPRCHLTVGATFGGLALVVPVIWGLFAAAGSMRTGEMVSALRRKRDLDRTSRHDRDAFETLQLEFDVAKNLRDWWQVVCRAAERMNFDSLQLSLDSDDTEKPRNFSWRNPNRDEFDACPADSIEAKIPFSNYGKHQESRMATVRIPSAKCLESAGQRLALFSRLLADSGQRSLRRIQQRELLESSQTLTQAAGEFGHLRVAFVHDFYYVRGGAERVVEQIINVLPHCGLVWIV